jgi:glucose/arabinose dehydrogenase
MLPTPVLDLSARVDSWNERGLLSVCFDPQFASNGWIYVYYTHNRNSGDASHTSSNNRVSRFTTKGNVADANSELEHLPKIISV